MNKKLTLNYEKAFELKHGENEHQSAALYVENDSDAPRHRFGPKLNYHDIINMHVGSNVVNEFGEEQAFAITELGNPIAAFLCVKRVHADTLQELRETQGLNLSGKCLATNKEFTNGLVTYFTESGDVPESIIAPKIEDYAMKLITKSLPLLKVYTTNIRQPVFTDLTMTRWGIVEQTTDRIKENLELDDRLAWAVVKNANSFAVAIVRNGMTLAIAHSCHYVTEIFNGRTNTSKLYDSIVATDYPFKDSDEAVLLSYRMKKVIFPGSMFAKTEEKRAKDEGELVLTKYNHLKI